MNESFAAASATLQMCINNFAGNFSGSDNDHILNSTSSCGSPGSEYDFFKTEDDDYMWFPQQ